MAGPTGMAAVWHCTAYPDEGRKFAEQFAVRPSHGHPDSKKPFFPLPSPAGGRRQGAGGGMRALRGNPFRGVACDSFGPFRHFILRLVLERESPGYCLSSCSGANDRLNSSMVKTGVVAKGGVQEHQRRLGRVALRVVAQSG